MLPAIAAGDGTQALTDLLLPNGLKLQNIAGNAFVAYSCICNTVIDIETGQDPDTVRNPSEPATTAESAGRGPARTIPSHASIHCGSDPSQLSVQTEAAQRTLLPL